jgi:glycerol-3-phosphate acyltransferase PlsX
MTPIAVDAMGGDHCPEPELDGAVAAAREGSSIILVGDRATVGAALEARGAKGLPIEIAHASQVVTMEDHPASAYKRKRDSSMRVCFDLVKRGDAAAVVSAGNSGAMLACGLFVLGRVPGIDRPGIVSTLPSAAGPCALLDMGANVELRAQNLAQFAVMGAVYAKLLHGHERPRVGLLSNGTEEHKGTELLREAHRLLKGAPVPLAFDYLGFLEGRDIWNGRADVVVTDGFTGNVVLKTAEGVADTLAKMLRQAVENSTLGKAGGLLLRRSFREMKRKLDWAEYGGAPLLGVQGIAMMCHGSSPARAIKNAILGARAFAKRDLAGAVQAAAAHHRAIWETISRPEAPEGRQGRR